MKGIPLRCVLLCLMLATQVAHARGLEGRRVYLKVMATSAPVHSGPGGSYREIGRIGQGQVYTAMDRSPDASWYRVRLARGVSGWVLAELVWPFEIADEGALDQTASWLQDQVLGESHLVGHRWSFSLAGGMLDTDGLFSVRVGLHLNPHHVVEITASQSPSRLGSLLMYQAELLLTVAPERALVPFLAVGGGGATTFPGREVRLFEPSTHPMVSAGGGFFLALKGLSFRLDVRRMVLFSPEQSWGLLAITGGVALAY